MPPLKDARTSLRWAKDNLESAHQIVDSFLESQPYSFSIERQGQSFEYLVIVRAIRDVPPELSKGVLQFAHHTRSGLNFAMHRCADLRKQRIKGIDFPVFRQEADYLKFTKRFRNSVSLQQWAVMQEAQPYKRGAKGGSHPLWRLHQLNRASKHRKLQIVGATAKSAGIFLNSIYIIRAKEFSFGLVNAGEIAKSGTPIARFVLDGEAEMDVHPQLAVDICFGQGSAIAKRENVLATLNQIYRQAKEVIDRLEST